jgi:hypothetical protein
MQSPPFVKFIVPSAKGNIHGDNRYCPISWLVKLICFFWLKNNLENDGVRKKWEGCHPIYENEKRSSVPNHQPVYHIISLSFKFYYPQFIPVNPH